MAIITQVEGSLIANIDSCFYVFLIDINRVA